MPVVLDIVAMLSKGTTSGWLPNKSLTLNILAITFGVAFLAFALAVYDGYKSKVERIIFSLTPHVMVRPAMTLSSESEPEKSETERCIAVCRRPFAIQSQKDPSRDMGRARFAPQDVQDLEAWLAANGSEEILGASRVLFEEAKLSIELEGYSSGGPRPIRLLGIEPIRDGPPAPRVDLAFTGPEVAGRFASGNGLIISDALAAEIETATGQKIEPGSARIRLGQTGAMHDYEIAGIHRLGIHAISRNLVIAPYAIAMAIYGGGPETAPTYVGLTLRDPEAAKAVAGRVRAEAGQGNIAAVAWQSVNDLFDQLALYRAIIYVTLSLSILVTAINTFVNMNILVMERGQQIGVMRAMGLGPRQLLLAFMCVGLLQSLVGTSIGYVLGISVGYMLDDYINSLVRDFIPIVDARIEPDLMVFLAMLAFVSLVSVVTCRFAGRRALGDDIIENLRSL